MPPKRAISDVILAAQLNLKPYDFAVGPTNPSYLDENKVEWVQLSEFVDFEISETRVVRNKLTKRIVTTQADNFITLFIAKKQVKRSVNQLYRFAFNVFEPFSEIPDEKWCKLAEYPDIAVSNHGRVMNHKNRSLLTGTDDNVYIDVKMKNIDQKYVAVKVHTLIALAFIGPPPTSIHTVQHKNGINNDNRITNLRYITPAERREYVPSPNNNISLAFIEAKQAKESDEIKLQMKEEWLKVPISITGQNENAYFVSNYGKIRRGGATLEGYTNYKNYMIVSLNLNGESFPTMLHRIVATTFLPNPFNLPFVDHIDFNRSNNHVWNLQWISARDNAERSLGKPVSCYDPITKQLILYESVSKAANQDQVKIAAISRVCRGDENRTQYQNLYWWFTNESPNGLQEIEEEVERRRILADKSSYNYKESLEKPELQRLCMLHLSCPQLCNYESSFTLTESLQYPFYQENGVKWIKMIQFPGYEISEKSVVRDIRTKEIRPIFAEGRVRMFVGDHEKVDRTIDFLYRQHFTLPEDVIDGEIWKHCEISKEHCVSNMGRVLNCQMLKMHDEKEEKQDNKQGQVGKDLRLNASEKSKRKKLYMIVADFFLPKRIDETDAIDFIDGNVLNAAVSNLRRKKIHEKQRQVRDDAKTTALPVLQLDPVTKEIIAEFPSQKAASVAMGFTGPMAISNAVNRGTKSNGFLWKRKE
jgi:hypothetical protein